ncbi:hypothetical protein THAOC_34560, partial [Thalassiosira oceanica]
TTARATSAWVPGQKWSAGDGEDAVTAAARSPGEEARETRSTGGGGGYAIPDTPLAASVADGPRSAERTLLRPAASPPAHQEHGGGGAQANHSNNRWESHRHGHRTGSHNTHRKGTGLRTIPPRYTRLSSRPESFEASHSIEWITRTKKRERRSTTHPHSTGEVHRHNGTLISLLSLPTLPTLPNSSYPLGPSYTSKQEQETSRSPETMSAMELELTSPDNNPGPARCRRRHGRPVSRRQGPCHNVDATVSPHSPPGMTTMVRALDDDNDPPMQEVVDHKESEGPTPPNDPEADAPEAKDPEKVVLVAAGGGPDEDEIPAALPAEVMEGKFLSPQGGALLALLSFFLLALLAVVMANEKDGGQDHRMNVLLLYADDWRYDTLGVAGNPVVKTPVLDALSQEGVRFTENCVTTSICWISRATLYSGQYLARHKFKMIGKNFHVPQKEMVYSLLKKNKYTVGHVGKLGLNVELNRRLNFNFYDEYDGWHWKTIGDRLWHVTEKNTADALRFLKKKPKNKPFFLNVAYYATHAVDTDVRQYMPQRASMSMYLNDTIFEPEDTYDKMPYFFTQQNEGRNRWRWRFDTHEKHQRMMKNYYRMASEVDTSVGTIVDQLRKSGELNNTMIIFTTATILSAAGVNVPLTMMGRDMSVLYRNGGLKGEPAMQSRQLAITKDRRHYPQPAKDGDGKFHSGSENSWRTEFLFELATDFDEDFIPASEALVRKDFKYFYWPQYDYEQLFDIRADPKEMNDLANSTELGHKKKLAEMRTRFNELKDLAHSDLAIIL